MDAIHTYILDSCFLVYHHYKGLYRKYMHGLCQTRLSLFREKVFSVIRSVDYGLVLLRLIVTANNFEAIASLHLYCPSRLDSSISVTVCYFLSFKLQNLSYLSTGLGNYLSSISMYPNLPLLTLISIDTQQSQFCIVLPEFYHEKRNNQSLWYHSLLEEGGSTITFEGTGKKCLLKTSLRVHSSQFYWKVLSFLFANLFWQGWFTYRKAINLKNKKGKCRIKITTWGQDRL